jgi:sugar transferase EpsL
VSIVWGRSPWKRACDLAGAALLLVLLGPLLALVATLVRIALGPPVVFRQERLGKGGRPFVLLKFRTMRVDAAQTPGPRGDAERLTRLGIALRGLSLDELPELLNVLRGDMSLVGPRPLLPEYLPLYSPNQARRHEVRPGITGWAQVNGRNALTWDERFRLDVWYVDHASLRLDTSILLRTVLAVLRREGISHPGSPTMEPFRGPTH